MKILDFAIFQLQLASRLIIIAVACAVIFFGHAVPTLAFESDQSPLTKGTTQLPEIQRNTDETIGTPIIDMKESQEKTKRGLNEVQGEADIDKMKRPENSQDATSVEDQVEDLLNKFTGNK